MRRVLLDEGVPVGVRGLLPDCSVVWVGEVGWAGLTNGALIAAAEADGFEIMVTADQNIRYQQNMAGRRIALVVLNTNHWITLREHGADIRRAVDAVEAGGFVSVALPRAPLRRRPYPR